MSSDLVGASRSTVDQATARRLVAILVALLDSAAPIPYLFGFDPLLLQAPAILMKLLLIVLLPAITNTSSIRTLFLAAIVLLALAGTLVDAFSGPTAWQPMARYWAVALSMLGTLSLVSNTQYATYAKTLVVLPALAAALHITMAMHGTVPSQYGRFFYFRGSHPNLGGEIAAAAGIAAALALNVRWLLPVSAVLLADCLLLQSRAAILAILLSLGIRLLWSKTGAIIAAAGAFLLLAWLIAYGDFDPADLASSIFRLDDYYRGVGSGFAGRSARWDYALSLFFESPVWGAGLSIFGGTGERDPHNAFLFGLASHGLMSLLFWLVLASALRTIANARLRDAAILGAGWVLLVFNDRFLNLNLYPLAYYAFIVCYPAATSGERPAPAKTARPPFR